MSTAQVFQAARGAATDAARVSDAWASPDAMSALSQTGLPVGDIGNKLQAFATAQGLTPQQLAEGANWYNSNVTPFAGNANWWGPETRFGTILSGLAQTNDPTAAAAKFPGWFDSGTADAQTTALGKQMTAAQQQGGGDDFFGSILPILGIGAGLMFGLPSIMSMLGGGVEGAAALGGMSDATMLETALGGNTLASGGMSFAPSAFSSPFLNASVIPGSSLPGASSFLSNLGGAGAAAGGADLLMENLGGMNPVDVGPGPLENLTPLDASEFGTPNSVRQGPLGTIDDVRNWIAKNPWVKNVFGGVRGALSNRDNPLLGALLGTASSFMPGTGGPLSNALGVGSGLYSMMQGIDMNRRGRSISSMVDSIGDPYAGIRAQAAQRLNALASDPSGTLSNLPGYKAGLDAITRQRAAMGQLGSGNLATALLDYGGNIYNQERAAALNQLGMGDPYAGLKMKMAAMNAGSAGNSNIMNGLATIGFGLNRMGV